MGEWVGSNHPRVAGRCPACGLSALFLGEGGWVTCGNIPCPNPTMVADLGSNVWAAKQQGATHVDIETGALVRAVLKNSTYYFLRPVEVPDER